MIRWLSLSSTVAWMPSTPRRTVRETDPRWYALADAATLLYREGVIASPTRQAALDWALDRMFKTLGMTHVPTENTAPNGDITRIAWMRQPRPASGPVCGECGATADETMNATGFCDCGALDWQTPA